MAEFIPSDNLYSVDPESQQEEKLPSWVDKFGGAFAVLVIGIALFVSSFALILWNEYRTVEEEWKLNEGSSLVVSLESDQPDSDTNGQLIHMTGKVSTQDILSDELFYISGNGVKMSRVVEMYQWSQDVAGGKDKKTRNYRKIWSQKTLNSTKFKQQKGHVNPPMDFFSGEYIAGKVSVGGFTLSDAFIVLINDYQDFPMTEDTFAQINPNMAQYVLHNGEFYKGSNPDAPEIGDIRVHFRIVRPGKEVSVIGMQNVDSIDAYLTDYNSIKLLVDGKVDADTMLRREVKARDVNVIWLLRFGGWFVMMISIGMMLYSFSILLHVLPLVGGLVGYNNYEMSFFLSLALTLMTVAMAWFAFRPGFALGLLVLGASLMIVSTFLNKKTDMQLEKEAIKQAAKDAKRAVRRRNKPVKRPKAGKGAVAKDIPAKVKFFKAPKA